MDIEVYREFMVLATHKSYVSASRDLNMSQPSLSRHMTALQHELGCRLFYETRPLSLTAAGEVVLRFAGKIVGDQANMQAELRKLSSVSANRITIVDMLHTNTLYLGVSEAVTQAKQEFPGLRVDYLNMNDSGLSARQMVEAGKVDLSFEAVISDGPSTELDVPDSLQAIWIPEFHGELVLGVGKDSPLASRTDLRLEDLAQSRFIMQANRLNEHFKEDFIRLCSEAGFYPDITLDPSDNPLEFYATNPADGIHLISKVDKKYKPLIASLLKQNVAIVPLTDKKRYVDAYALMRKDPERPELDFVATCLAQHAETLRASLIEK